MYVNRLSVKKFLVVILMSATCFAFASNVSTTTLKEKTCPAAGAILITGGMKYTCAKLSLINNKKVLQWNAGVKIVVPPATTTTRPTPTTTWPAPTTTTTIRAWVTAAVWSSCNAPVGGVILLSYSNGTSVSAFVNWTGFSGKFTPTYLTVGYPGGSPYNFYIVKTDNLGNPLPQHLMWSTYGSPVFGCYLSQY
jgi:hypothetical protein